METEKKEILATLKEIAKSRGEYILLINGTTAAYLYPVIDNTLILSLGTDLEFTIDKIEEAFYNDNTYATIKVGYKYYDIDIVKKVEMKKLTANKVSLIIKQNTSII